MSLRKFKLGSLKDKFENADLEKITKTIKEETKVKVSGKVEPKKKNKK